MVYLHDYEGKEAINMAFFTGNIYSKTLMMDTQLNVILPQDGRRYIWEGNPKTLILLHGLTDNAAVWYRKTAIERYAERYDLTVVMPEIQRSWYQDMKYGIRYYAYLTDELPDLLERLFKTSIKRDDLLVAGLSMGGYGALRCAFGRPDRFGFCGAFSGAYDLKGLFDYSTETAPVFIGIREDLQAIFGENIDIPHSVEVSGILEQAKKTSPLPKLYLMGGTDDFLFHETVKVHELCNQLGIEHTYEAFKAFHEWDVWDEAIEKMLKLFLGDGRKDWV
jgi:S-formylglutathione hydrolase FrmB